jgi:hypothetical protein
MAAAIKNIYSQYHAGAIIAEDALDQLELVINSDED